MLSQTPFYNFLKHKGAHFSPFAGWEMPVFFFNIKTEHYSVRNNAGLFDISHMGNISIKGEEAEEIVSYLVTNDIKNIEPSSALYSLICSEQGYIIDDIIIYKNDKNDYLLIVNASNTAIVYSLIQKIVKKRNVLLENLTEKLCGLALQGPDSYKILKNILNKDFCLDYFKFTKVTLNNNELLIARTGYTGEIGYELWMNNDSADKIIELFVNTENVTLCGLGARDILRLEAGYPLYGNELSMNTNPYEANLGWTVKTEKKDFLGKEALIAFSKKDNSILVGFIIKDRIIPRKGCKVFYNEKCIGLITSGSFSYTNNCSIALGYIDKDYINVNKVVLGIRNKKIEAEKTKTRFYYNPDIKSNLPERVNT